MIRGRVDVVLFWYNGLRMLMVIRERIVVFLYLCGCRSNIDFLKLGVSLYMLCYVGLVVILYGSN